MHFVLTHWAGTSKVDAGGVAALKFEYPLVSRVVSYGPLAIDHHTRTSAPSDAANAAEKLSLCHAEGARVER